VRVSVSPKPVSDTATLQVGLAGDDGGEDITGWELYVDGFLAGTYGETPISWDARDAAAGKHELLVAAFTEDGNVWTSDPLEVMVDNTAEEMS
jgi:hypothetical protein